MELKQLAALAVEQCTKAANSAKEAGVGGEAQVNYEGIVESALRQTRNDTLEEAAKQIEKSAVEWDDLRFPEQRAMKLANDIRALKGPA